MIPASDQASTQSDLGCPHCGYVGAFAGQRYCPNCGQPLPQLEVRTTQVNVTQQIGEVQPGGEVAGVKIGQIIGNVFVGTDEEAQARQRRNLRILLEKVKSFWTEGVLATAVRGAALIELEKRPDPDSVARPLAEASGVQPPVIELPAGIPIAATFDAMDRALLIMDGAGSGKTTTLLELTREAVARAEADPASPIPVVLNLSSWSQAQPPIVEWITAEMALRYQIPREMGRRWLEEQRLALLLDGLDEVGHEHIRACIVALNRFREEYGLLPISICTRTQDYRAAAAALRLSGAVELLPLTPDQIEAYLAAAGEPGGTLRAIIQEDPGLQQAASSPMLLNLMRQAFAGMAQDDLKGERFDSPQERRAWLVGRYIDQQFARSAAGSQSPFTRPQTLRWLGRLAYSMAAQHQSIFLVEQLQPAWLPTGFLRWFYWVGSRGLVGLLFGFVLAFTARISGLVMARPLYVFTAFLLGILIGFIDGICARVGRVSSTRQWVRQAGYSLAIILLSGAGFFLAFQFVGATPAGIWWLTGSAALVFGLLFAIQPVPAGESSDVRPVEALAWSWRAAARGLLPALLMFLSVVGGAVAIALLDRSGSLGGWLRYGLSYGFLVGVAVMLIFGLRGRTVERRSYPNQGVWLSARNAARAGAMLAVVGGPFLGVFLGPQLGLYLAVRAGVLGALWYGLYDVLKHLVLRALLAASGALPRNLVPFLEHTARLGFLQKAGGGYLFANRLLQDYLAERSGDG